MLKKYRLCFAVVLALCGVCSCSFSGAVKTTDAGEPERPVKERADADAGATLMPRADPGYVQYLERQSMLFKSSDMARVVSGSGIAWRNSAAGGAAGLLKHADTWVLIHPMTMLTSSQSTVFSQLSESAAWAVLREIGASGLYVAPIQGSGFLWARGRKGTDTGDDVVQYDFSRTAGTESQYKRLMQNAVGNNVLIGSDLVPAATGLGPDFFLALRGVREYPGIYCMVEIPDEDWKLLPEVNAEAEGAVLGPAQVDALDRQGLLPKSMRDEVSPLSRAGGWAATGPVRGVDGISRRWVYRWYRNPAYAVLNWEDPSQTAHRILSGSAVKQVGLQGQALIGLRFEAFQGLEPVVEGGGSGRAFSIEPARTAAQSMGREIKRYGAWSWVRDDGLPLNVLNEFLSSGVDYIFDGVFTPAAEHALLTGDAEAARFSADEALRLGVDFGRLVHVMPAQDGINYALPSFAGGGADGEKPVALRDAVRAAMRAAAGKRAPAPVQDNRLYAAGPALAAMALDVEPASAVKDIQNGHALLIFFKAMQPGLLMLAGQDLCGVLPLPPEARDGNRNNPEDAVRGGYGLGSVSSMRAVSTMGTSRAPQLYPPPDVQVHSKDSFLRKIGAFLRPRRDYGIGRGRLLARPATKEKGSIALLTRLPEGNALLLALSNFSRSTVTEVIDLSGISGADQVPSRVTPIVAGGAWSLSGKRVTVTLGPWQGTALVLGAGPAGAPAKKKAAPNADGAIQH